jgi:hypothetical protein
MSLVLFIPKKTRAAYYGQHIAIPKWMSSCIMFD